jgi:NADH-quinone oxidoreductase subunit G
MLQLHKSQDNVFITECYAKFLGEIGGEKAHHLLHTTYQSRHRIMDESLPLMQARGSRKTSQRVPGNQLLPEGLAGSAEWTCCATWNRRAGRPIDVRAGFCIEKCECGPT